MIKNFLISHSSQNPVSFHMPGHKGRRIYERLGYGDFFSGVADFDITEISGADNLFQAEGIILETMKKYRELYRVRESYLLINGTSGGLIAAMMASVRRGGRIIMARNCHKSVFNGLVLGNITPVYAYPENIEEYGISGEIKVEEIERLMDENPDAEAVILPSPNYYGICSDIEAIAAAVHERNKVLIVDQAHGAHLKFFEGRSDGMPPSAELCGADIIVNSTHKTLASFTQSAVLNLNSDRVDKYVLEDKLQMIESTSPSYILMGTLDINADIIKGHSDELFEEWQANLDRTYEALACMDGVRILNTGTNMDRTKINLDFSAFGIDGSEAEKIMMEQGVFPELVTGPIVMCMTGIGNSAEDYDRLLEVAASIAGREKKQKAKEKAAGEGAALWSVKRKLHAIPTEKENIKLEKGEGRICASSIIPYPPGIPLVCPGEKLDGETLRYISYLRQSGEKVIGVNENSEITVGKVR